jgi:hypothetical protein
MFKQAIKKGELVVDAGPLEGFIPPATGGRRLKTDVPQVIRNLGGCLEKFSLIRL